MKQFALSISILLFGFSLGYAYQDYKLGYAVEDLKEYRKTYRYMIRGNAELSQNS